MSNKHIFLWIGAIYIIAFLNGFAWDRITVLGLLPYRGYKIDVPSERPYDHYVSSTRPEIVGDWLTYTEPDGGATKLIRIEPDVSYRPITISPYWTGDGYRWENR